MKIFPYNMLAIVVQISGLCLVGSLLPAWAYPLILTDRQERYAVGRYLEYLEAPSGSLTLADVRSPEYTGQFIQSHQEVPNFGYTDSVYWVRFPLRNAVSRTTQWRLEIGFPHIHDVTFYRPRDDAPGFEAIRTGMMRPFATRDIPYHRFVFRISLPAHAEQTVYLRFRNGASMTLPLTLWSLEAFTRHSQRSLLLAGSFYGALLVMIGYHVFLWLALRERSYLFYISFMLSIMLMQWSYDGFAGQYWWPNAVAWKEAAVLVFIACIGITAQSFTMITLGTHERAPSCHALMTSILIFWTIVVLLIPFISYGALTRVVMPVRIFNSIILIATSFLVWQRGYRPARYVFWAWLLTIVTNLLFSLLRMGLLPSSLLTEHGYQFAIVLMALLLSRALTDRIQSLREEKEAAQQQQERMLIQKSKLESLGVLAAGIAHEINQPLTRIAFGADTLLLKLVNDASLKPEALETTCRNILKSVDRISHIIDHVRTFSRDQALTRAEPIDVHATIHNALSLIQMQFQRHKIRIDTDLQATGRVMGNQYKLEQVLLNLLSNARDAIEAATSDSTPAFREDHITIRAFNTEDRIVIEIADSGAGMTEEILQTLFDPFFTTKAVGKGTGLGLSISYGIIQEMQGEMTATSQVNAGTVMTIALPRIP